MSMKKLIVVIDETGAFRPQENSTEGFGVGAIFFPDDKTSLLVKAAKEIGTLVGKEDFKYKHVQGDSRARAKFIQILQADGLKVFGFYSSKSGVAEQIARFNEAATLYGRVKLEKDRPSTERLLDMFLGFAMGSIACHALVNSYTADLYWDRRNDIELIKGLVEKHIEKCKADPRLAGAEKAIRFAGQTTVELYGAARLAGILAGDLRLFFDSHGKKIWKHLDADGLRTQADPYRANNLAISSRLMSTRNESLADPDPYSASESTVMLQAYYQSFLSHVETKRKLISFCDPQGHMGLLEIDHGRLWHIRQSAD
jgi:hypothetical protein